MNKLRLEGFNTLGISEEIRTPDVAELLSTTMVFEMLAEDVWNQGDGILKYFLMNAPLQNKHKYVWVSAKLQYLTPETLAIPNNSWHCDPGIVAPFESDQLVHILATGSKSLTSTTEFIYEDYELETEEDIYDMNHREFREFMDEELDGKAIDTWRMPTDKYITFNSRHLHRALFPRKPEFRYFFRVVEANYGPDHLYKPEVMSHSSVWALGNGGVKTIPNIIQNSNEFIIRKG